jgi:hypothetical protein
MSIGKGHRFNGRTIDGQQIYTVQNNLITPYQFTSLPTGSNGGVKWTESPPVNWAQYGPYYNLFNKVYLKRDGTLETTPNGGRNVHSIKVFGLGSRLGLAKMINVQQPIQEENWSLPIVRYSVDLYDGNPYTHVKFGVFYKVNSTDQLRPKNFAGIFLNFTRNISYDIQPNNLSSYVNYAVIHGGDVDLLGNSSNYTYLNNYLPSVYDARNQWISREIIKFKKLAQINQNSVLNNWQYLEYIVPIPTFSNNIADPDGTNGNNGPSTRCTLNICFGENNSYLDDGSGINSGSVLFYYPFLNLI